MLKLRKVPKHAFILSTSSSSPSSYRIRFTISLVFTFNLSLGTAAMISQVSSNASSLTTKERHYAQLAAKLGTLANSFDTTKQHLNLAAEQAFYMRKLGIAQASTFMAVLHEVDREQDAQPTEEAQQ